MKIVHEVLTTPLTTVTLQQPNALTPPTRSSVIEATICDQNNKAVVAFTGDSGAIRNMFETLLAQANAADKPSQGRYETDRDRTK